ncbi:MAG: diaminopimelate epimerase [Acidimicrobiia bacterium]|nr:diaminopimelate epimerase [Acidimicrobiia bacterium]MDX2468572.1 diaminopimelate epimerase [Acidimicrobiia bacterium]
MDFVKMHGLGNDFVVISGPSDPTPEQIASWCDRRRGIGADGVLEVIPIDSRRVRMRYWNADGGLAEMCGNGLRCVARFAADRGLVDADSFVVDTSVGPRPVHLNADGSVRVLLGTPTLGDRLSLDGIELHTVDMGNPHAIHWIPDTVTAAVDTFGPRVETDDAFPNGTNVEFARVSGPDEIDLRVWERGVGETLACGTGAAATAYLAHQQGLVGANVTMHLLGGVLRVDLDDEGAWIEGPAETVFSGSL